jgi:hypothetical protein
VTEKEVRDHFDRLAERMGPQKFYTLDIYKFPLVDSARAARHALEKGQGADYLEKTLGISRAEFFFPKASLYESTLEPNAREALKGSRKGAVAGPLELRERGGVMYYVVQVLGVVEKGSIPYANMKDTIRNEIRNRKLQQDLDRIIAPEAKRHPVSWVDRDSFRSAFLSYLEGSRKGNGGSEREAGKHRGGH